MDTQILLCICNIYNIRMPLIVTILCTHSITVLTYTPEKSFGTKQRFLSRIQLQMLEGMSLSLLSDLKTKENILGTNSNLFVLSVHYPPQSCFVLRKQQWVLRFVGVFAQVGSYS